MGRVVDRVDAVDLDEIVTLFCQANCVVNEVQNVSTHVDDASRFPLRDCDAWHLDPDRRETGRRTVHPENFSPDLRVIRELLQQNPNAAVKMAPATDTDADWLQPAELHWIGHRRSCQQLVAYFGELAQHPGQRVASIVDGAECRTVVNESDCDLQLSDSVGEFVYEPHAAVLSARCTAQIASLYSLKALIPGGGYLTSNHAEFDGAMSTFQVLASMPFHEKKVRQTLKSMDVGQVEVKKRAVDIDPGSLQSKWKGKGSQQRTVIILRRNQAVSAIIAKRLSVTDAARLA